MANGGAEKARTPAPEPFPADELRRYIETSADTVRGVGSPDFLQVADSLDQIAAELPLLSADLEAVEQRLTLLEQKLIAIARSRQTEEDALQTRRELETYLRPWRSKMTASQISMLEVQYRDRATLERAKLPRLSLFYLK
jgi:hypothetical protein